MFRITVLLTAICILCSNNISAQRKFSLSGSVGSGFSFFRGEGSADKSVYYRNGLSFPNAIDTMANHWGQNSYGNFSAGLQGDLKLSSKWVLQFITQYERTGGRLTADSVHSPSGNYKTSGKYFHYYDYISFNPRIGYIVKYKILNITLHAGIDYTSKLERGDQFNFTDQNGKNLSIGHSGGEPEINDCRLTAGAIVSINKWALDFNYKHGITNYNKYSSQEVYSRMLHFRLLYRVF